MIKMKKTKPTIGISLRVVTASNYDEKRDALSHDWTKFFEKLKINPLLIPNRINDITSFLDDMKICGIILSGGDNIGDNSERDKTEEKILNYSIEKKIPLIGICRGMQVINKFFGGTIKTSENSNHVGNHHSVSLLANFVSLLETENLRVNSFHNNIIKQKNLGQNLEPFAISDDNTIEGFYHSKLPIFGIMWHPEREQNHQNEKIIRKIFSGKNRKIS
jgi:putative glutamine amidotransferase